MIGPKELQTKNPIYNPHKDASKWSHATRPVKPVGLKAVKKK